MNLHHNIPKQIEYRNSVIKQITRFIQQAEKKSGIKESKTDDTKKWTMPAGPKGFIKCKEHDPL